MRYIKVFDCPFCPQGDDGWMLVELPPVVEAARATAAAGPGGGVPPGADLPLAALDLRYSLDPDRRRPCRHVVSMYVDVSVNRRRPAQRVYDGSVDWDDPRLFAGVGGADRDRHGFLWEHLGKRGFRPRVPFVREFVGFERVTPPPDRLEMFAGGCVMAARDADAFHAELEAAYAAAPRVVSA